MEGRGWADMKVREVKWRGRRDLRYESGSPQQSGARGRTDLGWTQQDASP